MEKIIKTIICITIFASLTACCKHKLMNKDCFASICTGTEFTLVTKEYGNPYDHIWLDNGITEYRYIQRNEIAPGVMEHVHFIITVGPDGKVINKTSNTITNVAEINYR